MTDRAIASNSHAVDSQRSKSLRRYGSKLRLKLCFKAFHDQSLTSGSEGSNPANLLSSEEFISDSSGLGHVNPSGKLCACKIAASGWRSARFQHGLSALLDGHHSMSKRAWIGLKIIMTDSLMDTYKQIMMLALIACTGTGHGPGSGSFASSAWQSVVLAKLS